jgi:Mor family transcriptional regulator
MTYIPAKKENGTSAERLRGVLADAVGDSAAEKILGKIMALYGAMQIYFPLERKAFRKTIALEIYARCDGYKWTMNDLAREYGITAMTAYHLWEQGQQEKLKPTMPYLPFLETAETH